MKRILIVGGGSAGWMAAAYLNGALNQKGAVRSVDITLVESPSVARISVGEATIPSIRHVLAVAGIDEHEFMKAADATFKQAIKYPRWRTIDDPGYYHPFSRYRVGPIDRSSQAWLNSDRSIPFMETVSAQPIICEMGLAPLMIGPWTMGAPLTYAYHLDAEKFADYLRDFSVARGVDHILEHVTAVNIGENGLIASIATEAGRALEADLFIDCTGFGAKLIGESLGVGFEDCSQWLLCDQAVVAPAPYEHHYPGLIRPYSTATAASAGWIWDIPLQSRRGLGYVHSSAFITADDAERELRAYEGRLGGRLEPRLIRFQVGRRKRTWAANCVAIGLSAGFIEPLESTGLYLADLAAVMLAEHFPTSRDAMELMAMRVNRILENRFYEILDFVNMHYCLTRRTDTAFWREVQKPERITDRLKAKFAYWRVKPPSPTDFEDQFFPGMAASMSAHGDGLIDARPAVDTAGLWNHESYECIMHGMHFYGSAQTDARNAPSPPRVSPVILERLKAARAKLPLHDQWLTEVLGMPQPPNPTEIPAGWLATTPRG